MAAAMGLEVVAEGVESETTRALLAQNGCGAYQGYLFSPPLPLQEFESRVRTGWSMEAAAPEASAVQD
jgi:EAL domain-containing protein (putative c-di-GMP-specific phosphodiesterase class I)